MSKKEELAIKLDGREYGEEITPQEEAFAKENRLVVVFGASDDLMEIRGIVYDELSAWGGTSGYFVVDGLLKSACECDDCPYYLNLMKCAHEVKALWNKEGYSWIYETNIPHATFDILEDGEKYCRGIVFCLDDL